MKNYFIHESSYVDKEVKIGRGTKIWHFPMFFQGHILALIVIWDKMYPLQEML